MTVLTTPTSAPLPGSGLPRDRVAGNPRSFSAADLARDGRLVGGGLTETLERTSASVTRNDTGGNPFQPDVQIRGFTASPLLGTPQGIAVYQNGVRINEAFGDTVQWDLIPDIAVRDLDVIGSNPLFGLNAIGGAIALGHPLGATGAMILGMIPMALGVGEGGEQNAPLARAVVGGLLFATFATLIFVPTMYRLLRRQPVPVSRSDTHAPA